MNSSIHRGNRSHIGKESYLTKTIKESNRKGFTLVELIVVLVILAILAGIAVPVTLGFIDRANEKKLIKNGEVSLSAAQTVLNQVYNEGAARLSPAKRDAAHEMAKKAAEDAGELGDDTEFTVWTAKELDDGYTKATEEYLASFLIQFALLKTADDRYVFYNGEKWKVFDSEEALKQDNVYKNLIDGKAIAIWPAEPTDHAYNPKLIMDGTEDGWLAEDDIYDFEETITVVLAAGVEKNLSGENVSNISFGEENSFRYDKNSVFETEVEKLGLTFNSRFREDTIKWVYTEITDVENQEIRKDIELSPSEVDEYIKAHIEGWVAADVHGEGVSVTLTAKMDHKTITIPITFTAFSDALQVSLTDAGENGLEFEYDLVTGESDGPEDWSVEVSSNKEGDDKRAPGKRIATFEGGWAISNGDSDSVSIGDLVKDNNGAIVKVENTEAALKAKISEHVNGQIESYLENDEVPKALQFVAPATIHKTVYMWAIEPEKSGDVQEWKNTEEVLFGGNNKNNFDMTFAQYELEPNLIKGEDGKVIYQYSGNGKAITFVGDENQKYNSSDDYLTDKSGYTPVFDPNNPDVTKSKRAPKLKYWYGFECDKDGKDINLNAKLFEYTRGEYSKEVLTKLFAAENKDKYGEFVGIDVSDLNSKLIFNPKVEIYTGSNQDYSCLCAELFSLADATAKDKKNNVWNNLDKIVKVQVITKDEAINAYGYLTGVHKEVCISTTKLSQNANGRLDIENVNNRTIEDPDYPSYIVAFSQPAEGGYNIYIFTEDDTDMKAINSLQGLFMGCTKMVQNNFIEYADMSEVTRTKDMFKECNALQSIDLCRMQTQSTDMTNTFRDCYVCEFKNFEAMSTRGVWYWHGTFYGCEKLPENISMEIGDGYLLQEMFMNSNAKNITLIGSNSNLPTMWGHTNNDQQIGNAAFKDIFRGCSNLESLKLQNISATEFDSLNGFIHADVKNSLTSVVLDNVTLKKLTSTSKLFQGCKALERVEFNNVSFSGYTNDSDHTNCKLTDASYMFDGCNTLTTVQGFDFINTEDTLWLNSMFRDCNQLSFSDTVVVNIKSAKSITSMFQNCQKLTKVELDGNDGAAGLTNDNISNVFNGCSSLANLTIQNITNSNLTSLYGFTNGGRSSLETVCFNNLTLSKLNTLKQLFQNATNLSSVEFNNVVFSGYVDSETGIATKLTDVSYMFDGCNALTTLQGLDCINTENALWFNSMFRNCYALDFSGVTLDNSENSLGTFAVNIKNAKGVTSMFQNCRNLTNVTLDGHDGAAELTQGYISNVFSGCDNLKEITVKNITQSQNNITSVSSFVSGAKSSLQHVTFDNLTLPGVTSLSELFKQYPELLTAKVTIKSSQLGSLQSMFFECKKMTSAEISVVGAVTTTNGAFQNCEGLISANVSIEKDSTVADTAGNLNIASYMFSGCKKLNNVTLNSFASVTNMQNMFSGCQELKSIESLDTRNATNFNSMFNNCKKLESINVAKGDNQTVALDFSHAEDMRNMFNGCINLKKTKFYGTGELSDTEVKCNSWGTSMFNNCSSLTEITYENLRFVSLKKNNDSDPGIRKILGSDNANLKTQLTTITLRNLQFDQKTVNFASVFEGYSGLAKVTVDRVVIPNNDSVSMNKMFKNCTSLKTLDLTGLDTSKASNMEEMFYDCISLETLDLSGFDTNKAKSKLTNMFGTSKNSQLTTIYVSDGFVVNNNNTTMFGSGLIKLKGGNNTSLSDNVSTDTDWGKSKYAKIDNTEHKGYFTRK